MLKEVRKEGPDIEVIVIKEKVKEIEGLGAAIERWVMNRRGGVQAVNFRGTDGIWRIVGFEGEIEAQLPIELKEVAYRKQGMTWIEAFNSANTTAQPIDAQAAAKFPAARSDAPLSASVGDQPAQTLNEVWPLIIMSSTNPEILKNGWRNINEKLINLLILPYGFWLGEGPEKSLGLVSRGLRNLEITPEGMLPGKDTIEAEDGLMSTSELPYGGVGWSDGMVYYFKKSKLSIASNEKIKKVQAKGLSTLFNDKDEVVVESPIPWTSLEYAFFSREQFNVHERQLRDSGILSKTIVIDVDGNKIKYYYAHKPEEVKIFDWDFGGITSRKDKWQWASRKIITEILKKTYIETAVNGLSIKDTILSKAGALIKQNGIFTPQEIARLLDVDLDIVIDVLVDAKIYKTLSVNRNEEGRTVLTLGIALDEKELLSWKDILIVNPSNSGSRMLTATQNELNEVQSQIIVPPGFRPGGGEAQAEKSETDPAMLGREPGKKDNAVLSRRTFLKMGAGAVGGAAALSVLPQGVKAAARQAFPERQPNGILKQTEADIEAQANNLEQWLDLFNNGEWDEGLFKEALEGAGAVNVPFWKKKLEEFAQAVKPLYQKLVKAPDKDFPKQAQELYTQYADLAQFLNNALLLERGWVIAPLIRKREKPIVFPGSSSVKLVQFDIMRVADIKMMEIEYKTDKGKAEKFVTPLVFGAEQLDLDHEGLYAALYFGRSVNPMIVVDSSIFEKMWEALQNLLDPHSEVSEALGKGRSALLKALELDGFIIKKEGKVEFKKTLKEAFFNNIIFFHEGGHGISLFPSGMPKSLGKAEAFAYLNQLRRDAQLRYFNLFDFSQSANKLFTEAERLSEEDKKKLSISLQFNNIRPLVYLARAAGREDWAKRILDFDAQAPLEMAEYFMDRDKVSPEQFEEMVKKAQKSLGKPFNRVEEETKVKIKPWTRQAQAAVSQNPEGIESALGIMNSTLAADSELINTLSASANAATPTQSDQALLSSTEQTLHQEGTGQAPGGINLDPVNLSIKEEGEKLRYSPAFDPSVLQSGNFDGLTIGSLVIIPLNLPVFLAPHHNGAGLGMEEGEIKPEEELSRL